MGHMQRNHPLDRLINDDSLFILEAMIPFVDNNSKKLLVVLIKYKELSAIMASLSNPSYLSECGFDCHPKSTDEFITGMCNFMPESYRNSINQMQQMMNMMKLMNVMDEGKSSAGNNIYNPNNIFSNITGCEQTSDSPNTNGSLFDSVMSIINDKE